MEFICNQCDAVYTRKDNLFRHIRRIHSEDENDNKKRRRIICGECKKILHNSKTFHRHLKIAHQKEVHFSDHLFSNLDDFEKWKKTIEDDSNAFFVKQTARKNLKNAKCTYYQCHRSYFPHVRNKNKKSSGTVKISSACPANMKVLELRGQILVQFCSTHFGHENEIRRLPLRKEDRISLAEKLKNGIPLRRILNDLKSDSQGNLKRIHLIHTNDLHNIKRSFNITVPTQLDRNDTISVEKWIEHMKQQSGENDVVLFYKNQTSDYSNFETSDFILIIMTQFQKKLLRKFGGKMVCVDGTRDLNPYKLQLYSLIVADEWNNGIPVAFCLSNREHEDLFILFFNEIKNSIEEVISTKVFVSDGAPVFYNAWEKVMGPTEKQLLCSWHVNKNWVTNSSKIKSKPKKDSVMKSLKSLLNEPNPINFEKELITLLSMWKSDSDTKNFYTYFETNYLSNIKQWAKCYGQHLSIQSNALLESLHKAIKYSNPDGIQSVRLEITIQSLLELVRDKKLQRISKIKTNESSEKYKFIQLSHKAALNSDVIFEAGAEGQWTVHSSSGEKYTLKQSTVNEPCCSRICLSCNTCVHNFTCTCYDNIIRYNICAHIHAYRLQSNLCQAIEMPSSPVVTTPYLEAEWEESIQIEPTTNNINLMNTCTWDWDLNHLQWEWNYDEEIKQKISTFEQLSKTRVLDQNSSKLVLNHLEEIIKIYKNSSSRSTTPEMKNSLPETCS